MTTMTLLDAIERPSILGPDPPDRGDQGDRWPEPAMGGAPTLDDVLTAAWDALSAGAPAACLMCGGALEARYGAGHRPVAARCRQCGSELS
jgi:hypothetical protein